MAASISYTRTGLVFIERISWMCRQKQSGERETILTVFELQVPVVLETSLPWLCFEF